MEKILRQMYARKHRFSLLVLGDIMLDIYKKGISTRLCPDATAPIINIKDERHVLGGVGNTAMNLAALGADVSCMALIGNDNEGREIEKLLAKLNIRSLLVTDPYRTTICKSRLMADRQLIARYDTGTESEIRQKVEDDCIQYLKEIFHEFDAVIISDYEKGLLSDRLINELADLRENNPSFLAVDARDLSRYRRLHPDLVKPNRAEVTTLLHKSLSTAEIKLSGNTLKSLTGAGIIAVTMDKDGAMIFKDDKLIMQTKANEIANPHVSGAGDTYISAFLLAYLYQQNINKAAQIASLAAEIAISKEATAYCNIEELMMASSLQNKIVVNRESLGELVALYRNSGKRIVFTNGCFDILHSGHVTYLKAAARLGDILIVGINTDESVKRLKGNNRPVNSLADRMQVMAGLQCVSHIVAFGEITDNDAPDELIQIIQPEIFAKGGDYSINDLPEADLVEALGGVVKIIPLLQGRSTTGIIKQITGYKV